VTATCTRGTGTALPEREQCSSTAILTGYPALITSGTSALLVAPPATHFFQANPFTRGNAP